MKDGDLVDELTYFHVRTEQSVGAQAKRMGVSRKRLLQILASGGLVAGSAAVSPADAAEQTSVPPDARLDGDFEQYRNWFVDPIREEYFVSHGHARELRWDLMKGVPTVIPTERFYLQTHFPTPKIDPASYRLRVYGDGIDRPRSFSYGELLKMPSKTLTRAVECGENGRIFFSKQFRMQMDGTQWGLGAIGVATWTGVPLSEILGRAGLKRGAVDVMPIGLDTPPMHDHIAGRPMPVSKALADDTLLVWGMNGQTISANHGFPIRALVSGWIGPASIKWVGSIEVSQKPLVSLFNTEYGVMVGPDYAPEPPSKIGQIATFQNVKSALELAWEAPLSAGPNHITGRAWSGRSNIKMVEVSFDGGTTYRRATLRGSNLPIAWTQFGIDWDAPPGRHQIRVRATDGLGRVQPMREPYNMHGYLYGAVVNHPVNVT